jgi:hypothetical protein
MHKDRLKHLANFPKGFLSIPSPRKAPWDGRERVHAPGPRLPRRGGEQEPQRGDVLDLQGFTKHGMRIFLPIGPKSNTTPFPPLTNFISAGALATLPLLNGLEVCRQVRAGEHTRAIPIVMVTAKAEESDQVVGFSLGADDYVTKPFSVKVLVQRTRALLRRRESTMLAGDVVEHLGVRLDRLRHLATIAGRPLELTPTEFRLLECLLRQPGRAFTGPSSSMLPSATTWSSRKGRSMSTSGLCAASSART